MTVAAILERLGWQTKVSSTSTKSQKILGKVIKVQVGFGVFWLDVSVVLGLK